jgi:hypothetical protein
VRDVLAVLTGTFVLHDTPGLIYYFTKFDMVAPAGAFYRKFCSAYVPETETGFAFLNYTILFSAP